MKIIKHSTKCFQHLTINLVMKKWKYFALLLSTNPSVSSFLFVHLFWDRILSAVQGGLKHKILLELQDPPHMASIDGSKHTILKSNLVRHSDACLQLHHLGDGDRISRLVLFTQQIEGQFGLQETLSQGLEEWLGR